MKQQETLVHSKKHLIAFCDKLLQVTLSYYVALFHKDWGLSNSRIWLAEIDIDRSLDFPHTDRHLDG